MPRANRTGVPGLAIIETGPDAGRYRLGFRYTCPVTRRPKRLSKLYPKGLKAAAVKADAKALVNDALTGELAARETKPATKVTIASIAADVVKVREQDTRAPATLFEFRSIVLGDDAKQKGKRRKGGHIVRLLGGYAPHELTSKVLASFVDQLRDGGASPRTIRNTFKVLGQFLRIVLVRELDPQLKSHPIRDAVDRGFTLPSKPREAIRRLSQADFERLISDVLVPPERRARYAVALLSGLRDGEIAGLKWSDIVGDKGAEVLRVTKSFSARGGLRPPKTLAAVRDVPAHPELVVALRLWRGHWLAVMGREPGPEDPIFPRRPPEKGAAAIGKHYRPESADLLQRDLKSLGVEVAVDFHATRRSFASALEAAGVPHETIERLLGHELRSVLGQHYAAPDLGVLREAVLRLRLTEGSHLVVLPKTA